MQLLDCVHTLHNLGLVHGDIKPDNICLRLQGQSLSLYLIDFGLATKFQDSEGKHNERVKGSTFCGNLSFASINKCQLYNVCRMDDFEPIFYMLIYLLNDFKLPYENAAQLSPY